MPSSTPQTGQLPSTLQRWNVISNGCLSQYILRAWRLCFGGLLQWQCEAEKNLAKPRFWMTFRLLPKMTNLLVSFKRRSFGRLLDSHCEAEKNQGKVCFWMTFLLLPTIANSPVSFQRRSFGRLLDCHCEGEKNIRKGLLLDDFLTIPKNHKFARL